jgi:hypothetical protein
MLTLELAKNEAALMQGSRNHRIGCQRHSEE